MCGVTQAKTHTLSLTFLTTVMSNNVTTPPNVALPYCPAEEAAELAVLIGQMPVDGGGLSSDELAFAHWNSVDAAALLAFCRRLRIPDGLRYASLGLLRRTFQAAPHGSFTGPRRRGASIAAAVFIAAKISRRDGSAALDAVLDDGWSGQHGVRRVDVLDCEVEMLAASTRLPSGAQALGAASAPAWWTVLESLLDTQPARIMARAMLVATARSSYQRMTSAYRGGACSPPFHPPDSGATASYLPSSGGPISDAFDSFLGRLLSTPSSAAFRGTRSAAAITSAVNAVDDKAFDAVRALTKIIAFSDEDDQGLGVVAAAASSRRHVDGGRCPQHGADVVLVLAPEYARHLAGLAIDAILHRGPATRKLVAMCATTDGISSAHEYPSLFSTPLLHPRQQHDATPPALGSRRRQRDEPVTEPGVAYAAPGAIGGARPHLHDCNGGDAVVHDVLFGRWFAPTVAVLIGALLATDASLLLGDAAEVWDHRAAMLSSFIHANVHLASG